MARSNYRGGTTRRAPKDLNRRVKKKPCALCRDGAVWVDYKDVGLLRKFMSDRGKIRSRRVTGNCAQHQRDIAAAIKTARELVLLPYTQRTVTERPGGRGRGERPERGDRPDRGERGERPERGGRGEGAGAGRHDATSESATTAGITTAGPSTNAPGAGGPTTVSGTTTSTESVPSGAGGDLSAEEGGGTR